MESVLLAGLALMLVGAPLSISLLSTGATFSSFAILASRIVPRKSGTTPRGDRRLLAGMVAYFSYEILRYLIAAPADRWGVDLSFLFGKFALMMTCYGFAVRDHKSLFSLWKRAKPWLLGAGALAYAAVYVIACRQIYSRDFVRAEAMHHNPNYLAFLLLPAVLFSAKWISESWTAERPGARATAVLVTFFSLHGILLTGTRIALLTALAVIFALFLRPLRARFGARAWGVALLVALALRYSPVGERLLLLAQGKDASSIGRLVIWKINFASWLENPLFGTGFRLNDISTESHPEIRNFVANPSSSHYAHSLFLQSLAEGGLVGFTLEMICWVGLFLRRPAARVAIGAIFLSGLVENSLGFSRSLYPFLMLALLCQLESLEPRDA